jgi:hypothetical protein
MKITVSIKSPFVEREIERDFAEDGYLPLHPLTKGTKNVAPFKKKLLNLFRTNL